MATLDIVVLAVILFSSLIAFALGFVRVVLGLAGWVGAALITIYAFPFARPVAQHWIPNALVADVAALGIVFIVALILLSVVSHAISRVVRNSALSILDRTLGLAFGLALGVAIVCVGWMVAVPVLDLPEARDQRPAWARESHAVPLLEAGVEMLRPFLPRQMRGGPKSREAGAEPDPVAERQRQIRSQLEVAPKSAAPAERSGYDARAREELDRLMRSQR